MDLVTPLMQTLQANANLEHTEAVTQDTRALAQQRILNTQMLGINLQRQQNTMQALQQFLSGQPQSDPSMESAANDTPLQAQQKNLARMQRDANLARGAAMAVGRAGGDLASMDKMMDNATQASHWAAYAAREVMQEKQNQGNLIASIAGAVRDDDSARIGYQRLVQLDPQMAQSLSLDRDTAGNVMFGPKTQTTMQTLNGGGIAAAKQADLAIRVTDAQRKQQDANTRQDAETRKEQLIDSTVARNQASANASDALAEQRRRIGTGGAAKSVEAKPATGVQKKSAAAAVDAEFGEAEFDGSKDALVADVADRANKIMAEAKKNGETIGLDDARQQAIEQLKPFVAQKLTTKGGVDIPLIGKVGATTKAVNTYTRGKADSSYKEGQTATNPTTGEKLMFQGGEWKPVK